MMVALDWAWSVLADSFWASFGLPIQSFPRHLATAYCHNLSMSFVYLGQIALQVEAI